MTEEPRDPKPATWAGRKRAEGDGAADGETAQEERGGLTEELEGIAAELSAELDGDEDVHEDEAEEQEGDDEAEEQEADGEGDGEPEGPESQETVEADTLALAEREAAREAAHAGLRARTEQEAAKRGVTTGAHTSAPAVPAPAPAAPAPAAPAALPADAGEPPKRGMWWRFLAAAVVIVCSVATATSLAFLLFLTDIGRDLQGDDAFARGVAGEIAATEGDQPQTILIIGSDKRTTAPGDPGRSDTTMLLRVDPDKEYLALLSLPRDLRVEIPGYGTTKLNAAYSYGEQYQPKDGGGSALTLKTVKELLGIDVNHIVNINFEGFYDVVNAIGCVYIDVDRHYYNPVGGEYDDIDIQAGYQKLCGYLALDYVRYRHNDNDIVRGARQQGFVTEARQQIPPRDLLPFLPGSNGNELIEIFTKYTTSDIDDAPTILEMLKSFVDVRNAPVRQVELENTFETIDGVSYVISTPDQIQTAVNQFLGKDLEVEEPAPAPDPEPSGGKGNDKKDKADPKPDEPAMVDVTGSAQQYAATFAQELEREKSKLPVFYPTRIAAKPLTAITDESRGGFQVPDPDGKIYRAYKFVVSYNDPDCCTAYYGVSGTDWKDPPILNNPNEVREIDGREYMLFYDQDRLRVVGWKTSKGSYWVSNTLTHELSEGEMLAVATSTRELGD
jgi:polyisoprenyl-teichoic acid--peptidoglycan teichoic acid transferase